MANNGPVRSTGKKLLLGLCLSIIFLACYIGSGMLLVSANTQSLEKVFTEESFYSPGYRAENSLQTLSYDQSLSVLSLTEDQFLFDIDSRVSDSVEGAGLGMKQKNLAMEKSGNQEKSMPAESTAPSQETLSPASPGSTEAALMHLINQIRSSRGLQTLLPNPVLSNIASSRSQDMLSRGYFSHHTPEGKNIGSILQENGIMYACCAENLGQASPPSWGSPETIINMWMGSDSHRANLLNPHFGQMGLGIVDAGGRRIVTLVLINR